MRSNQPEIQLFNTTNFYKQGKLFANGVAIYQSIMFLISFGSWVCDKSLRHSQWPDHTSQRLVPRLVVLERFFTLTSCFTAACSRFVCAVRSSINSCVIYNDYKLQLMFIQWHKERLIICDQLSFVFTNQYHEEFKISFVSSSQFPELDLSRAPDMELMSFPSWRLSFRPSH